MRSLRLVRRVALLVPLGALLLGLVSTTVSSAASKTASQPASQQVTFTSEPSTSASTYSYFPLLDNREVFGSSTQYAAVDEATFSMAGGEIRRVTDQLEIRMNTGNHPEVDNKVICLDQNSNIIGPPGSQPVPFSNAAYAEDGTGTGTDYTAHGDAYQWNVSTLIEAPQQNPAENYFCLLLARIDPPYQMTVLAPTTGETTYGTWLEVSTRTDARARELRTRYCATNGTGRYSECSYIGGPARLDNPTAEDVWWQPVDVWTAADDATNIDGVATFEITECDWETPSCPPDERGDSGVANAAGKSYLDIDQLYPHGSVCQVNRAYSEESTGGQVLLSESYEISMEQHHLPLYYHISAPVSQTCDGSRLFEVVLYIQWTGGNDVKIDGGNVNLLNSVLATTTTVPDVTGLTAAQADDVTQAAGLTAVTTYVNAPGLPGTVVSQNPPGGTVEPTGSPVRITVTLGAFAATDPEARQAEGGTAGEGNAALAMDPGEIAYYGQADWYVNSSSHPCLDARGEDTGGTRLNSGCVTQSAMSSGRLVSARA